MSTLVFWLLTAAILLGAIALFVVPMLRGKSHDEQASRDELNTAFFHDRMAELKNEDRDGLVENQDELTLELQQSLLDDVPEDAGKAQLASRVSAVMIIPGVVLLVALSYGLYASMGNYDKVVAWQQVAKNLPILSRSLEQGNDLTDSEMQDLILALRTQMDKTPNDPTGWLLLGRLGFASRDVQTAEGAMARAYKLAPNDNDIILGYAQSMMLSGDEARANQARILLHQLVQNDLPNVQALSLLAFDAFERRDFSEAIRLWASMQAVLPADDPRQMMLSRSIERAHAAAMPADSSKTVSVEIDIADEVALPSDAVLVVTVHDANNSPIPVAAKLLPISEFPLLVAMTDADSMMPERALSALPNVIVKARIDTDGDVLTKDGDWFGETAVFALGEKKQIVINQQVK